MRHQNKSSQHSTISVQVSYLTKTFFHWIRFDVAMPRGRPKKQLQAIQEDEVLEDVEEQEECRPAIDEDKLRVIQELEAEGTPTNR